MFRWISSWIENFNTFYRIFCQTFQLEISNRSFTAPVDGWPPIKIRFVCRDNIQRMEFLKNATKAKLTRLHLVCRLVMPTEWPYYMYSVNGLKFLFYLILCVLKLRIQPILITSSVLQDDPQWYVQMTRKKFAYIYSPFRWQYTWVDTNSELAKQFVHFAPKLNEHWIYQENGDISLVN